MKDQGARLRALNWVHLNLSLIECRESAYVTADLKRRRNLRQWLNILGLVLGIVGVVLIFCWGPPQPSFDIGIGIGLEPANVLPNGQTVAEHDQDVLKQMAFYTFMSRLGLAFIGLGFLVQLVGSWPEQPVHKTGD
jgi:hypothetical protein